MNPHAFESAKADLQWLRGEDGVVSEAKAIERLANVLRPILSTEGYEISIYSDGRDPGFDLLAMPKMKPASPTRRQLCHSRGRCSLVASDSPQTH